MHNSLEEKLNRLRAILASSPRPAVAFSGGVDSTLLLYVASEVHRGDCLGVLVDMALVAPEEREEAKSLAEQYRLPLEILHIDPLADENVAWNRPERCYHCKRMIAEVIVSAAETAHCSTVFDGSNGDDHSVYRPGIKALREHGIRSPLAEAGLTKEDVRAASRMLQLATADKPAKSCLITRFPYDLSRPLTKGELSRAARGESLIAPFCHDGFRLRQTNEGHCWLAVSERDIDTIVAHRQEIVALLSKEGYSDIKLDLTPVQSGAFDRERQGEEKR